MKRSLRIRTNASGAQREITAARFLAMLRVSITRTGIGVFAVAGCFMEGGLSARCKYSICFLVAAEVVRWMQVITVGDAVHFSAQRSTEECSIRSVNKHVTAPKA